MKSENNFTTIMALSITIVSLLIIFNLVNIVNKVDEKQVHFKTLSAHAIKQIQENQTIQQPAELHSTSSYLVLITFLLSLISIIFILGAVLILPKIKHFT